MNNLVEQAQNFRDWWFGELRACLPEGLRQRLFAHKDLLLVEASESQITIAVAGPDGQRPLDSFDVDAPDTAERLMQEVRSQRKGRDIALVLPPAMTLAKVVELPLAVEENLAQVLSYEMDKHTPFKASQVYFGYRVVDRRSSQGRLRVRLVVVPREELDRWRSRLMDWGLDPARIIAPGDRDLNLLPRSASVMTRWGARINAALIALMLALVFAILVTPLVYMRQAVVTLNHEVARLDGAVAEAGMLQEKIADLEHQAGYLVNRRLERPYVAEILDEAARVLPDHTWVQSLEISGNSLSLSGVSESASGLIELIENSAMFEGVAFAAPVTRHPATGGDMFRISARLARAHR